MKAIFWLTIFGFGIYYGVKYNDKLAPFFNKSASSAQQAVHKPRVDLSMGTN